MPRPRFRHACLLLLGVALLWAAAAPCELRGQATPPPAPFTIADVFRPTNVSAAALSPDGRWLVALETTLRDRLGVDNSRYGDPTYVGPGTSRVLLIDTRSGESRPIFRERRQVRTPSWSPDGRRLALLVRDGDTFRPAVWDRDSGHLRFLRLPRDLIAAPQGDLDWTPDGRELLFALHTTAWQRAAHDRFLEMTTGPIFMQSSEQPFLAWEALRRRAKRISLVLYDLANDRAREVLPETMISDYALTEDGAQLRFAQDITPQTDYSQIFGSDNAVKVIPLAGGETRTILATTHGIRPIWSGDGRTFAYAREGRVYIATIDQPEPRQLLGPEKSADSTAAPADSAARAQRARERFTPVRLSERGDWLIATNRDGFWLVNATTGARERFLATAAGEEEEESTETPRYTVVAWSRDTHSIYLSYASRQEWDRGIFRYDRTTRQLTPLVRDGRMYSRVHLAHNDSTLVLSIAQGDRPADLYAADPGFHDLRRLTDANAWLRQRQLGKTQLVDYYDTDGKHLHGVLYYPADFQPGTRYPTVFIVYETFFDDRFSSLIALLNAHGYAVMQPSVNLEIGHPGEAWLKGVTAAANKLIEMGVADPDRLGIQGTSYGGYATNLLITQTDRFRAAINISGKVDMISFYTDSPRLGTRNIHAPEKSQDRLGASLWDAPQKYVQHSAIMFADRIKTPLLLMTGHLDPNVPERTTMEMYYGLRRLGKVVEWVSYRDGGHGMPTTSEAAVSDYHQRILGWYDRFLKGDGKKTETR